MIYLNSVKTMFYNFTLAIKSAIAKFLSLLVVAGVIFSFAFKPLQLLARNGFFETLWQGLVSFNFLNFFDSLVNCEQIVIDTILSSDTYFKIILIVTFAVGYFLISTLCNFDKVPICEVLDAKMSSNCRLNFTGIYFSRLWFSVKYTFTSLIFFVPIDALILIGGYFSLKLYTLGGIWLTISPFVVIMIAIILISLRVSLFSNWVPECVSSGKGVWKSFGRSVKITCKKFLRTFINASFVVLTLFLVNILMFVLTAGVGLIITIPATVLFINSFSMVNYYVSTGNRFYIDGETIVSPKKLETQEEIKDLIDLI